ncbi:MAG: polysaccharide pyruvyl transferase family protein [Bacillota bacterium]|uniref:polysaccharide pyruvyl transferase family protein n=1 Tax=unclassified Virgibacillus TaxID=2620237 RepID=UPI000EF45F1A|nr:MULTISPECIES: polysaccharide pyruvyl transferase family protein [unclassified Virgibacillus]MCC2248679.1 polysaccharide pyruvyl transferase family protein [Virgibacillus sp. AGTR]MDY7044971.1 polysaccharide pyruvyl transferase family protein [Virgibacillus sp. M23]QRZ18435.1 polysaccharide pyruvyl transferase family protein [Virgibacillus sp. AGTR]
MKNVMLYAYSQYNLGDDLFIKILCERYPNTIFHLLAPHNYSQTFSSQKNLKIIRRDSVLFRGTNLMTTKLDQRKLFYTYLSRNCDAIVYVGGSLFIQGDSWKKELKNVQEMHINSKPFFLLGANFGPFSEQAFLKAYHHLFQQFTDICFRDQYSYTLFKDLPNVRVATDMAFQLETIRAETDPSSVIISVIKPSIRKALRDYDAIYYKKIREIALYFIEQGYTVTLMSFCSYEKDNEAIEAITQSISVGARSHIHTFYYKHNLDEALERIASAAFIVATRFHSMILGWIFRKPVFPIVYSSKMTNIMKDINFQGNYASFYTLNTLKAETVFQSIHGNMVDITNQIIESEKQFLKLDIYLKTKT